MTYRVEFTAAGKIKELSGAKLYPTGTDRQYRGTVIATDPDDAFFKIAEHYRSANVSRCFQDEVSDASRD